MASSMSNERIRSPHPRLGTARTIRTTTRPGVEPVSDNFYPSPRSSFLASLLDPQHIASSDGRLSLSLKTETRVIYVQRRRSSSTHTTTKNRPGHPRTRIKQSVSTRGVRSSENGKPTCSLLSSGKKKSTLIEQRMQ